MTPTFTLTELNVLKLGLESIDPVTPDGAIAKRLMERILEAEKMIRNHGAVAAAF